MGETKTSWRVSAKGQKRKPAKKKPKAKAAEAVGGQTVQHAERLASSIELDEAEAGAPISMQTVSFIQQALDGMRRLNARAEYVTAHADELRAQAEATGRWLGTTEEEGLDQVLIAHAFLFDPSRADFGLLGGAILHLFGKLETERQAAIVEFMRSFVASEPPHGPGAEPDRGEEGQAAEA
jgi:hypothetical protein